VVRRDTDDGLSARIACGFEERLRQEHRASRLFDLGVVMLVVDILTCADAAVSRYGQSKRHFGRTFRASVEIGRQIEQLVARKPIARFLGRYRFLAAGLELRRIRAPFGQAMLDTGVEDANRLIGGAISKGADGSRAPFERRGRGMREGLDEAVVEPHDPHQRTGIIFKARGRRLLVEARVGIVQQDRDRERYVGRVQREAFAAYGEAVVVRAGTGLKKECARLR